MTRLHRLVLFLVFTLQASAALAVVPPGPVDPANRLTCPANTTYFAFSPTVKSALDHRLAADQQLGNLRTRAGRDAVLTKGGGVYVDLRPPQVFTVHMGYVATVANGGENSGRSYGVGPERGGNADDLSYPDLFDELEEYTKQNADLSDFYRAFFSYLMSCDSAPTASLDPLGRTLIADTLSIYMAETNRNRMANLSKFDWQKHLGDVTMLNAFHASTNKVWDADAGVLTTGPLSLFIGHGSAGSGVGGKGGAARRKFQGKLTKALLATPGTATQARALMQAAGLKGDLFHGLMDKINSNSISNSSQILQDVVVLLKTMRDNGPAVASAIK